MEEIAGFKEIAPYLTNPLVQIGFVPFLLFNIYLALLKAGIFSPLTPHTGGKVIQSLLRHGFVITLAVVILASGFAFYQEHLRHDPDVLKSQGETARLEGLAAMAKGFCHHPDKGRLDEAAGRACAQAVVALAQVNAPEPQKGDALARLEKGDAQGAKALFQEVIERKSAEGQAANLEAAEAARNLGALAFYDNTKEALAVYRKVVELDPNNPDGWVLLGRLLVRIGELNEAEVAYGKVKTIAEYRDDGKWLAIAYDNLGKVSRIRGDLTRAEAMHKKSLAIDEVLGNNEGMAIAYANLGNVYQIRGDLAQAEAMYKKALVIDEVLGRKEGMATAYGNLGNV